MTDSAELRRQAADARRASDAAERAARAAEPLAGYLPTLASAIEPLIGGTASGQDRRMLELLQSARRDQRAALEQCRVASRTAQAMAERLEREAREADAREAAERAAAERAQRR